MIDSSRKMSYSLDKDNMFRRLNNDTFKTSVKINHKEVKKTPVINYAAKSNCDIMVTNFTLAEGETEPLKSGGPAKFTFQITNYTSVDPHTYILLYIN
ncbi:hypothetical protein SH1V18_45240 [Vallitalea longa]|uniref:Uncharacterized protein n=1 Tax=Vallitalea longa TaxID=2936439 RepID=A0A9W6DIL6_9FIRM|nr:hypothetical protein [Vallitalea longa]GKX32044.1 hypothetical protein SH1V18_45240 [Vallitalea longa]